MKKYRYFWDFDAIREEQRFRKWREQLRNFLQYVDYKLAGRKRELELYKMGLEPIEAGEILLRTKN